MVWDPILEDSALEQAAAIRTRRVSSEELVRLYLSRIERHNASLSAFVELAPERALATARAKDSEVARGGRLPEFHGVPIGVKDLNFVRGFGLHAGSRGLGWLRWSPLDDRTSAALRRAGFVILGKLATAELGAMPVTEPDVHPPTRNPWDLERSAGGSSGGSCAAVAASLIPLAHGSDGAGSIRIPSAFCSLFGLKPSRGRLPNQFGLRDPRILYTCGPITRTVDDAAAMLDAMARTKPCDRPTRERGTFAELAHRELGPLRIRVATGSPLGVTHPEIVAATERVARALEADGHQLELVDAIGGKLDEFLPLWQSQIGAAPLPLSVMQPVTRWLAEKGRAVSQADRATCHDFLARRVTAAFGDADLWITPTVAVPPPYIGAWSQLPPDVAFREAATLGAFTAVFNITGQPAVSIPAGFTREGLPIGVQLAGRVFDEGTLLAIARRLEVLLPWRDHKPPFVAQAWALANPANDGGSTPSRAPHRARMSGR